MTAREKVIKGLELCKQDAKLCFLEIECPYQCEFPRCCLKLMADALELLKEQEAVVRCKDCKHRDPEDGKCDSGHGIQWQLPRQDDWFCADGERKEGR